MKLWRTSSRNRGGGQGNPGMLGRMGRMACQKFRVSRYADRVSLTSARVCLLLARAEEGCQAVGRLFLPPQPCARSSATRTWVPVARAKTRFAPTSRRRVIGRPGPKIEPYLPMRQANHQRESQSGRLIIRDSQHQDAERSRLSSRFPMF